MMITWQHNVIRAGACCATLLAISAAATAAPARTRSAAAPRSCSAASTQIWLGNGEGGGFAGGYVLPLEFSNVGRRTCTLHGYPRVFTYLGVRQVGPAAGRIRERQPVVTLAPGASAHASLVIADSSAVCGASALSADTLKVYAPGQRAAKPIGMPIAVCAHRGVLSVGAVRAGVGIPGYITE
jgi:hypothetical protein